MKTKILKHTQEANYSVELIKVTIVALLVTILLLGAVKLISMIVLMFI